MAVSIFKLISGELIVGDVKQTLGTKDVPLAKRDAFDVENPMFLHHAPQGLALVPVMPWAPPDAGAVMTFQGQHVMGECDPADNCHNNLLADYQRLTSRIKIAGAMPQGGGNFVPFNM